MYEGRTDSDLRALSMPAVAALAASGTASNNLKHNTMTSM